MSRSWRLFLQDMHVAATKIQRFVAGRDQQAFLGDEMAYDATLRNLGVLGEAAKGIPAEVRARYPEVDWKRIAGLRDILIHAYFAIDDTTLWEIVHTRIPPLIHQLDRIAESEE